MEEKLTPEWREKRRQRFQKFRKAVMVDDPESEFFALVIRSDGENAESFGFGATGNLVAAIQAVAEDVQQFHQWGRCAHCDQRAHAALAALKAYREVLGVAPLTAHESSH